MSKAKIGRNDPCPCGSGKKYKNCCLVIEGIAQVSAKPFDRYNTLMASLKMKLDQNYQTQIKKIRKPMQDRFLRLSCDHTLPREQESVFSDWLWFDMVDSEGMTFGREYLQEHGDYMEESLRDCLEALNRSHLSVFAIESAAGETLRLQDRLTGAIQAVILKEPLDLDLDKSPPLLLGRLAAMPGGTVFSGMVLMLLDDKGQGEFISRHMDYWQRLHPQDSIDTLLKSHGEVTFGLFDHASHKTTLALNDIRYLPAGADAAELISTIASGVGFIPVHRTAGTCWYDLKDSRGPSRVGINDDGYLVFYADVVDDLQTADHLLKFEDLGWITANSLLQFSPPAEEHNDIWYQVIKEREAERWLHTAHSELENKTPAQLLAEGGGKEKLLQMLDKFAQQAGQNQYALDLIDYMRARIV